MKFKNIFLSLFISSFLLVGCSTGLNSVGEANQNLQATSISSDLEAQRLEWLKAHPKYVFDNNKSLDENINTVESLLNEYTEKFGTTDKINTKERQELREQIANKLYGTGAEEKNKKAFLLIGLPAAGKSTISDPLLVENKALLLDADEVKKLIPEYMEDGLLTTAIHKESNLILNKIIDRAIENGDNVIHPFSGSSEQILNEKINKFKENGYTVGLIFVDLPYEEAKQRAISRFKQSGRYLSIEYLNSIALPVNIPLQNYNKAKFNENVDLYIKYDNNVPRGTKPILVEYHQK